MRITKTIATEVAQQLIAVKNEELKHLRLQQKTFIRDIYLTQLPKDVLICFGKNPKYFRTTSAIYINGPGLPQGYKTYSIGDPLPSINGDRITVTELYSTDIEKNEDAINTKSKEINELFDNIEAALINLRTYNNVEKEFPEAFKLLPPASINTGLMVNIKDIRCKLDKANC
jgi:hypothetical protein